MWRAKDSWSEDELLAVTDFAFEEKTALILLGRVCEESFDVKSCVNCVSAFFWYLTLPHCDFATRTEKKNTTWIRDLAASLSLDWNLNQEVKEWWLTWSLPLIHMSKGPKAKPSEPDRMMFWSAYYLHETTSAQSHIGTFVDIVLGLLDVKPFCQLGYLRITAQAD